MTVLKESLRDAEEPPWSFFLDWTAALFIVVISAVNPKIEKLKRSSVLVCRYVCLYVHRAIYQNDGLPSSMGGNSLHGILLGLSL